MAGASRYDKLCHSVFGGKGNGKDFLTRGTNIHCGSCGGHLSTYYCEEGLYLVDCERCKKRALVKAKNPRDAAYKTFAHEIIPIDEMGEENAVFFGTIPIVDPPYYVGSTIDEDFPDGLKCEMYLPCPGTSFPDMPEGSV